MALFYLTQIFKLWMLVDAYQRRPDPFWWFIILFVPFGEWAYFFVVKRHDIDVTRMRRTLLPDRPASLAQLRAQAKHSPSLANKVLLAQGLLEAGEIDEALALFREALERDPQDVRARHGLGQALLAHGEPAEAVAVLSAIVAQDRRYANGDAWVDLVEARWAQGDAERAIEEQRGLIRDTGRIDVILDLAEHLRELGRIDEARELLDEAVEAHQHQPAFVKRRDRAWARRARSMQKSLAKER